MSEETPAVHEKPLQTTNQVKANLINANMIKGDMILTKPGQGRSNQKVTFIQKQILMKPNELKGIGLKKSVMVPKGKLMTQPGTKFFATKDGKLVQLPVGTKTLSPNAQVVQMKATVLTQQSASQQPVQATTTTTNQALLVQQQPKTAVSTNSTPTKIKAGDIKKEKKKSDASLDSPSKGEETLAKSVENKMLDSAKKHPKKESRKPAAHVADTLGPALFSTPDIIRRVNSSNEGKADNIGTPTTPTTPPATIVSTSGSSTLSVSAISLNIATSVSSNMAQSATTSFGNKKAAFSTEQSTQPQPQLNLDRDNKVASGSENESKLEIKMPLIEEVQPSLDSGKIKFLIKETIIFSSLNGLFLFTRESMKFGKLNIIKQSIY